MGYIRRKTQKNKRIFSSFFSFFWCRYQFLSKGSFHKSRCSACKGIASVHGNGFLVKVLPIFFTDLPKFGKTFTEFITERQKCSVKFLVFTERIHVLPNISVKLNSPDFT
jgi:hypothetical protein